MRCVVSQRSTMSCEIVCFCTCKCTIIVSIVHMQTSWTKRCSLFHRAVLKVLYLQVRNNGTVPWLRPDGKTQVTVEYKKENGAMVPQRVHTILISTQHTPDVTNDQIHKDLMEHVIRPVVPAKYLDDRTIFHLNPSGTFWKLS